MSECDTIISKILGLWLDESNKGKMVKFKIKRKNYAELVSFVEMFKDRGISILSVEDDIEEGGDKLLVTLYFS